MHPHETADPRDVRYTVTLDTRTGTRQISGDATLWGGIDTHTAKAAVAQYATAGTSTPVQRVDLHPAQ